MGMQTDVLSAHLSSAGSYYVGRTRLKGIVISPKISTAVTFEIRNGSSTGAVLYTMDLAGNSNPNTFYILIPGEGILATTGLYLTTSTGTVTGITVFYG
jgi:hypothetical protein